MVLLLQRGRGGVERNGEHVNGRVDRSHRAGVRTVRITKFDGRCTRRVADVGPIVRGSSESCEVEYEAGVSVGAAVRERAGVDQRGAAVGSALVPLAAATGRDRVRAGQHREVVDSLKKLRLEAVTNCLGNTHLTPNIFNATLGSWDSRARSQNAHTCARTIKASRKEILAKIRTGKPPGPAPRNPIDRIMEKVVKTSDGCWLYTGFNHKGYGRISVKAVNLRNKRTGSCLRIASGRISKTSSVGSSLPQERLPVNPDHLEIVSLQRESSSRRYVQCQKCTQNTLLEGTTSSRQLTHTSITEAGVVAFAGTRRLIVIVGFMVVRGSPPRAP